MRLLRISVIVLAMLTLALATPRPSPGQSFDDEISIVEVEIPVHVVRDDQPVSGLGREDFQVFDNGEPTEIVGFRVIDLTPPASKSPAPAADATRQPSIDASATEATREGRSILLFFDFLFADPHLLERSLPGIRKMVQEQLDPADRVAVAYLAGTGAELVSGFTHDPRETGAALDVIAAILDAKPQEVRRRLAELAELRGGGKSPAPHLLAERYGSAGAVALLAGTGTQGAGGAFAAALDPATSAFLQAPAARFGDDRAANAADPSRAQIVASSPEEIGASFAAESESGAVFTLASEVARLSTLLRGVSGQKEILYLSEGFRTSLLDQKGVGTLIQRELEQTLFEALRRGGWTLNAIDVEGIPSPSGGSGEWGAGGAPGRQAGPPPRPGFDAEALHYLSAATGGMLFENFNHADEATGTFLDLTSLTYVLTIQSGELRPDGKLHRLDVRLRDPAAGTRLLHRTGYYAPRPEAETSPLERRLETAERILGEEQIDQLGARLRLRARPPEGGAATTDLLVEIPGDRLLAGRTGGSIDLDFQIYAVDSHEGVQDVWLQRLTLNLEELAPRIAGNRLQVPASVTVPEGRYRLRMLVRDLSTDRVSLTTTPLTLPVEPAGPTTRPAPGR